MGMKLFNGSEDSEEELSKIEINKDFARRYEHNKKREDLQKLEELKKKGVVEDSDCDSEDESSLEEAIEGGFIDSKKDLEFLNALIKVKNQDPELKNEEAKLFESENEEEGEESGEEGGKIEKKERPMYLKDVAARHLIEEGPEFEEKEEKVKSYSEEQEEFRRAFLDVAEEAFDEDDGELLKERERKNNGDDDDDDEEDGNGDAVEVGKKLDEYFGKDDNLDENEMFLKEYFRNRMWVAEARGKALDEEVLGFSEDEEEIEKQEDYERGFNFRFEENKGDRVLGHSRVVEGSVRKKTNARKVQRKSKEERLAQAEFERKEELKHLKNLKKKEMKEKLNKIRDTAGLGENWVCPLDEDDLEEEFDPEEYDRKMKEAFNDDYYDADDADPEFGSDRDEGGDELEKPNFDKEDELLGLPKGWDDVPGSGDGFLAARERNLKRRAENGGDHEDVKEAEEKVNEEGKQKKKQKMSKLKKEVLDKELEEYYKLDYEDTIGDMKTRFKYKEVGAKTYGLSAEEILMLDDKELNQYVSIKKLAPYREKEWKVSRNMRYNQKQRNKELFQERSNGGKKSSKIDYKKSTKAGVSSENVKAQLEKSNGDTSNPSRRSRRRHRLAELKLSQSRLMAYGKIPSKSKSKKKH
ncbi:hypothetical protein CEY00_Acc12321 [Actinidia chinensis var. chinensis]|uniref:Kri1-like C-terminal domain-containing protein n=1 Tax=Actinidia chinensis var. chinensis TaxID=1590841 RepID=A0A2R6QYR1_ACTCC|nr:hypothetical protein CEY00_Acc12321 [Actinidia chinensis var. chinensis]